MEQTNMNSISAPYTKNPHIYESFLLFQEFMDSFMKASKPKQRAKHVRCLSSESTEKEILSKSTALHKYPIIEDERPIRHSSINFVELVEKNLKELGEGDDFHMETNVNKQEVKHNNHLGSNSVDAKKNSYYYKRFKPKEKMRCNSNRSCCHSCSNLRNGSNESLVFKSRNGNDSYEKTKSSLSNSVSKRKELMINITPNKSMSFRNTSCHNSNDNSISNGSPIHEHKFMSTMLNNNSNSKYNLHNNNSISLTEINKNASISSFNNSTLKNELNKIKAQANEINTQMDACHEFELLRKEREAFLAEKNSFMQTMQILKNNLSNEKHLFERYKHEEIKKLQSLKQEVNDKIKTLKQEFMIKEQSYRNVIHCLKREIEILTTNANNHNHNSLPYNHSNCQSSYNNIHNQTTLANSKRTKLNSSLSSSNKSSSMPKASTSRLKTYHDSTNNSYEMVFAPQYIINKHNKVLSKDKYSNGKVVIEYDNHAKEYIYPSGDKELVFPDGYRISYYVNQDIKQVYPNGKTVYYFADSKITQTFLPETHTYVYRYKNGLIEKHNKQYLYNNHSSNSNINNKNKQSYSRKNIFINSFLK